jgi:hypothetical protein
MFTLALPAVRLVPSYAQYTSSSSKFSGNTKKRPKEFDAAIAFLADPANKSVATEFAIEVLAGNPPNLAPVKTKAPVNVLGKVWNGDDFKKMVDGTFAPRQPNQNGIAEATALVTKLFTETAANEGVKIGQRQKEITAAKKPLGKEGAQKRGGGYLPDGGKRIVRK